MENATVNKGFDFMPVWNIYLEKPRESMNDDVKGVASEDLHIQTKYLM